MLTVQVELLTGRYVATRFNNRNRVEWPPHPARLFSAAVAIWADADEPDPAERSALVWWEEQGSPQITCSWGRDWSERAAVTHYVPVNDTQVVARDTGEGYRRLRAAIDAARSADRDDPSSAKDAAKLDRQVVKLAAKATADSQKATTQGAAPTAAIGVLPDSRGRQARVYPAAIPVDDRISYTWPETEASPHITVLDGLLARVARLGHSSSPVAIAVVSDAVDPTLVPHERGSVSLRVTSPGQLDALEQAYELHRANEPRTLPAEFTFYREATPELPEHPRSLFGTDWILLDLDSRRRCTIADTLALARAVRGALMRWASQPPPQVISGHRPGPPGVRTAPSDRAHLAIVPLPFVGHRHADGSIQGVALLLPTSMPDEGRSAVLNAVGKWTNEHGGQLRVGDHWSATVSTITRAEAPASAESNRWTKPARRWLSVTPIALDRHPGNLRDRNPDRHQAAVAAAEDTMRASCRNIGLPEPLEVTVRSEPYVTGSRPARSFPAYTVQGGRLRRQLVHAELQFAEPVVGPVLLGAGRYLGYGLCFPFDVSTASGDGRERTHG